VSAWKGVSVSALERLMQDLGYVYEKAERETRLSTEDLPSGRLLVPLRGKRRTLARVTAVIDGVIHDVEYPSEGAMATCLAIGELYAHPHLRAGFSSRSAAALDDSALHGGACPSMSLRTCRPGARQSRSVLIQTRKVAGVSRLNRRA
jgi:hypothetical protein